MQVLSANRSCPLAFLVVNANMGESISLRQRALIRSVIISPAESKRLDLPPTIKSTSNKSASPDPYESLVSNTTSGKKECDARLELLILSCLKSLLDARVVVGAADK